MLVVFEIIYLILLFFATYYVIFHLFYWFENRSSFKRNSKRIKNKDLPAVSLIVPAYNEEKLIGKTIGKLKKINYQKNKLEIIIVDDGSEDRTYEIAKGLESKQIKVFKKQNGGKASALNFGIGKSKNDFIAVMDADSYLEKNALKNCIKYFDEDVAAVTSHILVGRKKTFWERMQNIEYMLISTMRKAQEFSNVIGATPGPLSVYKRKILKKLKGFDEKNLVEDVEIAWRILSYGYKIKMAFEAMAYSFYPSNFKKWWRQRIRWIIGGLQTLSKHLDTLNKKTYGTGGFWVPFSILGYLATFIGIGIFFYLVGISIYNLSVYSFKSYSLSLNPFARWELVFNLDIKIVFGFMVFLITLLWLGIALKQHKWKFSFFDLFCFLTVYGFLSPFVLIYGVYKYFKGERGWLTK